MPKVPQLNTPLKAFAYIMQIHVHCILHVQSCIRGCKGGETGRATRIIFLGFRWGANARYM